jgi:ribonuclease E
MVNTNEKNENPKKRSRLFGGRRAAQDVQPPVEAIPEVVEPAVVEAIPEVVEPAVVVSPVAEPRKRAAKTTTTAKGAADHVNAAGAALPEGSAAPVEAAAEAPRRRGAPKKDAVEASVPAVEKKAPVRPTTSLLFQAPDLPPLPPQRAPRGNGGGNVPENDLPDDAGTVRRRSRRRPGEESRPGDEAPNTVVRVRQPRPEPVLSNEPTRVKGSTRLEAKKQRRRDGRDAGRRRPVVTESEFLARRESVDRVMVVRSKFDRIQIAVLEDGVLVEHYVAKSQDASLIGNVYLGRVQNVLPSMEAAFVDIGRGRNAVLYSGEVDWEAAAAEGDGKNQARRIELALKPGDRVLVQVTKDPVGHKGARLTSQVSLPGRYLVYVPNGSMSGISRKLPDTERARLKKILKEVLPENVGVIVRTAAEGATEEQLTLDVQRLTNQWAEISRLVESQQAPALLHSEPDLLIKIVRDVFNEDFQKLVIEGDDARQTIESYLRGVAPDLLDRLATYEGNNDSFDEFRVSEQIEKALDRKVWLPSGGSLVIDRTEAMTVVDVNTGKFVGSGGNLEETVTKNNLEAAEEIVRQLRLRDIGGIIVVDFIDMVLESNRDLVLRRLVECLSRDRTKHQVAEVTSLGLVQMTRKKLGLGLLETFSEPCEVCSGRGIIVHHDPVTKHRQQQQTAQPETSGGGRRGRNRGGNGGGGAAASSTVKNGVGSTGTHAITEDVRNALARVAASTVHTTEIPVQAPPAPVQVEEVVVSAAEAAVEILDIPVAKAPRQTRKISTHDAEQILDSVLEALPEPKQPGQGRSRVSRRVSSPVITTENQ